MMTIEYYCPECEYLMKRIYADDSTTFIWHCECCGCVIEDDELDDDDYLERP